MELPKDLRFISLKYDGRCRSCATSLKAGERAHWSPSSKGVWCIDCTGGAGPSVQVSTDNTEGGSRDRATKAPRSPSASQPVANSTQTSWQQLCDYAQRCIEAEAAKSLVPYVKENSQWFLHLGEEKLVVGQSDSTPAPGELPDKLRSRTQSIIYGWPTIVVTDRDHTPKVAPLFAVQIEPERGPNYQWILHATMEPEFNLAITASGIFDPSIAEDISELLSHGLPFGDTDAFGALAERTADLLGLQILSPLNARILESNIGRKKGVYNAAISVCGRVVWIHQHPSRGTATTADPRRLVDYGCGTSSPQRFRAEGKQATPVRASCGSTCMQPITGGSTRASPQRTSDGRDRSTRDRQDATRSQRGHERVAGRRQSLGDLDQQWCG